MTVAMFKDESLRKRFCKDRNLSISVFEDPYFVDRLTLYGQLDAYKQFVSDISKVFASPSEYFDYYGKVKDSIIDYIKGSDTYQTLQTMDLNTLQYRGVAMSNKTDFPDRDIFNQGMIGRTLISLDMRKANYSALVLFGKEYNVPFVSDEVGFDYDKFIRQFTDNEHIVTSKYIRQVVFGNCNPKRQVFLEKCLMLYFLNKLFESGLVKETDVVSVHNDELIFDGTVYSDEFVQFVTDFSNNNFPIRIEKFIIGHLKGTDAFIKKYDDDTFDIKCMSPEEMPFIYRFLRNEKITVSDKVFVHNNKLAMFINEPTIEICY